MLYMGVVARRNEDSRECFRMGRGNLLLLSPVEESRKLKLLHDIYICFGAY